MNSSFVNITIQEVVNLQSQDEAVGAIRSLSDDGKLASFPWLRKNFGRENGVHNRLDRGRAPLKSTKHLDQYLWSYGPMIKSQWETVSTDLSANPSTPFRLIDYGCGQGVAGLLLSDNLGSGILRSAKKIVLVEPSEVALVRAEAIYRHLAPNCPIFCVRKPFDDLSEDDLMSNCDLESLHIFSNVLDINTFDQFRLFEKILTKGKHTILAISHDRDHDGGSGRIRELEAEIRRVAGVSRAQNPPIAVSKSSIRTFKCNNTNRSGAIVWFVNLDVLHG
jgi:hypothetical protein